MPTRKVLRRMPTGRRRDVRGPAGVEGTEHNVEGQETLFSQNAQETNPDNNSSMKVARTTIIPYRPTQFPNC